MEGRQLAAPAAPSCVRMAAPALTLPVKPSATALPVTQDPSANEVQSEMFSVFKGVESSSCQC